jgi:dethiobiotin synthetase
MVAVFVTGTGTDVGKTFVTASLIRHARASGRTVNAIKPVASGFDPASVSTSDPGVLLAALGRTATSAEIERIAPWRFAAPLSPDLAAQREGRALDFAAIVEFSRRAAAGARGDFFIEGVGGIMVPLDARHTMLDWMSALQMPLLLVAGSYLGTISHTLSALAVLEQRRLDVRAVVISESEIPGAPLDDTVATIARFAGTTPIIAVPRMQSDACEHHASCPAWGRIAAML